MSSCEMAACIFEDVEINHDCSVEYQNFLVIGGVGREVNKELIFFCTGFFPAPIVHVSDEANLLLWKYRNGLFTF